MKTNIIIDPLAMLQAGIFTMVEAVALVHLGRCGINGAFSKELADTLGVNNDTMRNALDRLLDKGLATDYQRIPKRGCPYSWCITAKGWEILMKRADLKHFPTQSAVL